MADQVPGAPRPAEVAELVNDAVNVVVQDHGPANAQQVQAQPPENGPDQAPQNQQAAEVYNVRISLYF